MNDLIILGAGPGGYELAIEAGKKGLKVTLIEAANVGGTCLNCGCIPTKAYYKSASLVKELNEAETLGVKANYTVDFSTIKNRKDEIVKSFQEGILFSLKKAQINIVNGYGKLIDKNTVKVNDEYYQGKYIAIATGSSSVMLPGFENDLTSTEILNLNEVPKRLAIVGGGVIGIEFASIFANLGSEVTVIEYMDRIIPNADKEISKRLLAYLKQQGIKFYLNSKAMKVEGKLQVSQNETLTPIEADTILVSVGRKPNLDNLGLDEVGISYNKKGILVNENFKTNIDNIYAIGDVNGKLMLAHYATYNGYQVLKDILNEDSKINFNLVPSCVFTFPEVSWIGLTEEEVKDKGLDYQVYKGLFRANGKAVTLNASEGFVKLIVSNEEIIGCSTIGHDASTLIHEISIVMNQNLKIDAFLDIIHAHPTLSEIFPLSLR